ncbi:CU044_5270 family protein [Actinomadura sp. NAK00032]|uniref:CU044_5270 family protein n=1 Tax=Actinomadura sp. NAK00032 TaxID=2742128 RepID=UPI001591105D|nr:CU044_5270 family protein [Actinomadura sp. NAK00032]QKW39313.1 CU044_5270 family protein [Actinomadura sp. NAK00032]
MDELDALRGMRTALAEEESPERLALRTDWRNAPRERPRRRLRMPVIAVTATAAVTAGALTAVVLQPGEDAAPAEHGTTTITPGNALLVAATNAQKAPNGRYWHTKTVMGDIFTVGKSAANHYRVDVRQGGETWIGQNGKGRTSHLELTDVPLTAKDKAKWEAAGSPTMVEIPNYEGPDDTVVLDMSPQDGAKPYWMPSDDRYLGMTAARIAELPTDAKALEKALLDLKGHWHAVSKNGEKEEPIRALRGQERTRALSEVAATLLSTAPAPPAVRAAVFRLLADLPGVKAEGPATDPLGRPGMAISLPLKTTSPLGMFTAPKQLGTYRRQFIIAPDAGSLLAIRDLVVTPPHGSRPLPPGDDGKPRSLKARNMPDRFHKPGEMISYKAFEVTEWTNAQPPR